MSAYSTSSPSTEQVRLYLMRPPSAACTWWNRMSWLDVAEYSLTGTLTSPNDTAPLHIARMPAPVLLARIATLSDSMAACSPCSPPLEPFRMARNGCSR